MELFDLDQAMNLSLVVINNIFLLFLNVVDGSLNLGCQILFKLPQVVLLLLVFYPKNGFLLFFVNVYFYSG